MNYYNDNNPDSVRMLKGLISDGIIPGGDVDGRSIEEVRPGDLEGYTQCHFFAGIGGWPVALGLAGWHPGRPVWTGSCPCQPFSFAGNGGCEKDERHLWPEFFRLIKECRPPEVFGEQVTSKNGRHWFAAVRLDMETMGYAVGAADLCAAGVGAPHARQRIIWGACREVSDTHGQGRPESLWRDGQAQPDRRGITVPDDAERWIQHWLPEPGLVRVVHGVQARPCVVTAYGNAIVPEVASEFIGAFEEATRIAF